MTSDFELFLMWSGIVGWVLLITTSLTWAITHVRFV